MICSDGHPSSKIAALGWNPEDEWLDPALRELVGGPERLIEGGFGHAQRGHA